MLEYCFFQGRPNLHVSLSGEIWGAFLKQASFARLAATSSSPLLPWSAWVIGLGGALAGMLLVGWHGDTIMDGM